MQKQHSFAKRDGRRAFTLVELVVAMALFAIVAGMVVSFIIFINRFSDKSAEQTDRMYALSSVRSETDHWFSYFDSADYSLTIAADGNSVSAAGAGGTYSVTFVSEGGNFFLFTYPRELGRGTLNESENRCEVRVDAYTFTGIRFYNSASNASSAQSELRFTIFLRVANGQIACEIVEEEAGV